MRHLLLISLPVPVLLLLAIALLSCGLSATYTLWSGKLNSCELGVNYGRVYVALVPGRPQRGLIVDGANFRDLTQGGFGLLGLGFSPHGNRAWGGGGPVFSFPLWIPILLLVWAIVRTWRRRPKPPPGQCTHCGYDLRATPDRCPECGAIANSQTLKTGS